MNVNVVFDDLTSEASCCATPALCGWPTGPNETALSVAFLFSAERFFKRGKLTNTTSYKDDVMCVGKYMYSFIKNKSCYHHVIIVSLSDALAVWLQGAACT